MTNNQSGLLCLFVIALLFVVLLPALAKLEGHDKWYEEGWKAYIDGAQTETYITDYGFIGIIIPDGQHNISLKYTVPKAKEGIAICLFGIVNLIIMILSERKKKIDTISI